MKKILIILLCVLPHCMMAQQDQTDSLRSRKGDEIVYGNASIKIIAFCVLGDQKYIVNHKNELIRLDQSNKVEKLAQLKFKMKSDRSTYPFFVPHGDGAYLSNYINKSDYAIIRKDKSVIIDNSKAPDPKKLINYNVLPISQDKYLSITHTAFHPSKIDKTVILHRPNAQQDTLYKYTKSKSRMACYHYRPTLQAIYYGHKIYILDSLNKILQIHDSEGTLIRQYQLKKSLKSNSIAFLDMYLDQANGKVYIKTSDNLYYLAKDEHFYKQNIKKRFFIHQIYNNQIYYSEYNDNVSSVHAYDLM